MVACSALLTTAAKPSVEPFEMISMPCAAACSSTWREQGAMQEEGFGERREGRVVGGCEGVRWRQDRVTCSSTLSLIVVI